MKLKITTLAIIAMIGNIGLSQNILGDNTDFSDRDHHWVTGAWGDDNGKPGGDFVISKKAGQDGKSGFLKIKVTEPTVEGDGFKLFAKKENVKLKKKKKYKLTFWVRSQIKKDHVVARIYSGPDTGSKSPWAPVMDKSFFFKGDKKWQQMEFVFVAESLYDDKIADFANLVFVIGFDKRVGTYHVDNITIERVKETYTNNIFFKKSQNPLK